MTSIYDVLRRPIITEKSNYQTSKLNQVVFEVSSGATKAMVKEAVETVFDVTVTRVNVINVAPKRSRRPQNRRLLVRRIGYKKAIVTLADGDTIDIIFSPASFCVQIDRVDSVYNCLKGDSKPYSKIPY